MRRSMQGVRPNRADTMGQLGKFLRGFMSRPVACDAHPIILVTGPESSGTRIFTEILAQHPDVIGTRNAQDHHDVLDHVWQFVARRESRAAARALAEFPRDKTVLTRRSMPHGSRPGASAEYRRFPDLDGFTRVCEQAERPLQMLVTSRSPAACLASSVAQRASVAGNYALAGNQYLAAYNEIFRVALLRRVPYLIISVEALVLDGDAYIQSLFSLCKLPAAEVDLHAAGNPNTARYLEFMCAPGSTTC